MNIDTKNDFLFSIIVPVYNTEKYVEKCLQSIKDAIDLDCEVIIVNDGSTDNSEERIFNFINNLPLEYKNNFIYTKKENKGLSDTKNVGISMSRGKYISVIDSDDYISKDFYKIAREYIPNHDLIVYDIYVLFEDPEKRKYNYISHCYDEPKETLAIGLLSGAMQGSSCNKIIKRELYNNYQFPVGVEYEDVSVTPFLLFNANNPVYLPYPLYTYLQRENSIVANNTFSEAFYKICNNISSRIANNHLDIENYKYIINEFFVFRILDCLYYDCFKDRKNFFNKLSDFRSNNLTTVEYILNANLIYSLESYYTERQKKLVSNIFLYIKDEKYKKIRSLFVARRFARYFRNVLSSFVNFILYLIGRKK